VAERKRDLSAKLGGETASAKDPPGWKQQITPVNVKAEAYLRKTYLITPELIERVKVTAKLKQVGQNELVRYLLNWALGQLDDGTLNLPVEVEQVNRIKF